MTMTYTQTKNNCQICNRPLRYDVYWAIRPSKITLYCPRDGCNDYGWWNGIVVCANCRVILHDTIASTIKQLKTPEAKGIS